MEIAVSVEVVGTREEQERIRLQAVKYLLSCLSEINIKET